ncbi:hypothetical protein GGS23DRAFT_599375 [Durotheca rogersii]|uniref:uncharacterized protein n=1 Tax=Durotheca rogersii TaxID=419775 RepID=UPI00221E974E|nr:uncharacterized protein GGS23DRAFT_599375 [Durotheca rogersii]KAI5860566.1 hypothetical protein GGS23DRAFT_599375 [Durotheca rogersii]
MESPRSIQRPFDHSKPFDGLVLCCTSIDVDLRTEIAQRTTDLGGSHKYDLTSDVTHLIVGEYDTAKYRHVARERPDIKPMAAGWVNAVRQQWLEDKEFDFVALEDTWRLKPFETGGGVPDSPVEVRRERTRLVCCLTGFKDAHVRNMIEEKVVANGGEYVCDLSKRVTHLIVCEPHGKKYLAARKWGIRTVSIEWLHDSAERGMILNEDCYDPTLPEGERGKGAWTRRDPSSASLGKRPRDGMAPLPAEESRRKLRKTASMKLMSQKDNVWSDILVKQSATDLSSLAPAPDEPPTSIPSIPTADPPVSVVDGPHPPESGSGSRLQPVGGGVFSSCRFYVHGFSQNRREVVNQHISSHGGHVSSSIEDAASPARDEPPGPRYLVVPQSSQPSSHPKLPEGMHIVTEFYIERCVHNKTLFNPTEHVLGQPFPQFPIDGFGKLTICTTGFRNEQLNQVEKALVQLGANYSERLNPQCSLLLCPSLNLVRKQKLDFAVVSRIPVVDVEWLWQCIATGCLVPRDKFLLARSLYKAAERPDAPAAKENDQATRPRLEPMRKEFPRSNPRPPAAKSGIDMTAFEDDTLTPQQADGRQRVTEEESYYETAPTHQPEGMDIDPDLVSAPLSGTGSSVANKSQSQPKAAPVPRKIKRFPTGGEIGDSQSDQDSGTPLEPAGKDDDIAEDADERQKQREGKSRVAAAEREEMAKRLDSLVGVVGTAPGSYDASKPASAPAPRQRRKREILGRAASNVSAASSASADSAPPAAGGPRLASARKGSPAAARPDAAPSAAAGAFGLLDKMMMMEEAAGDDAAANGASSPPRATQLQYDNPEARRHRATVLSRMLGGDGRDELGTNGGRPGQKKAGRAAPKEAGATLGMVAAESAGKRVMRRR